MDLVYDKSEAVVGWVDLDKCVILSDKPNLKFWCKRSEEGPCCGVYFTQRPGAGKLYLLTCYEALDLVFDLDLVFQDLPYYVRFHLESLEI